MLMPMSHCGSLFAYAYAYAYVASEDQALVPGHSVLARAPSLVAALERVRGP